MSLDRCRLNARVDKAAPLSTLRRPAGSVGWKTSAAFFHPCAVSGSLT